MDIIDNFLGFKTRFRHLRRSASCAWENEFFETLKKYNETLDAFTWHDYPLGQGYSDKVDSEGFVRSYSA